MSLTQITGALLIFLPIAFNVIFFLLQRSFEYPDILRKPTDYILREFNAGGNRLLLTWYCFALTGLLFIPLAILVDQALDASHTFRVPLPMRVLLRTPVLRDIPARIATLGARRVRLERPEAVAAVSR